MIVKRLLLYGFPLFLISLEMVIRLALKVDSSVFIGPTLAGIGVGYLLPLTGRKSRRLPLSDTTLKELQDNGLVVTPKREDILIDFIWLFVFALLASWAFCVFVATENPNHRLLGSVPTPLALGLLNYVVGVVASEIKEVI